MCDSNLTAPRGDFNPYSRPTTDPIPDWEILWIDDEEAVQRFPVPGGWLYLTCVYSADQRRDDPIFALQTFVPEPERGKLAPVGRGPAEVAA